MWTNVYSHHYYQLQNIIISIRKYSITPKYIFHFSNTYKVSNIRSTTNQHYSIQNQLKPHFLNKFLLFHYSLIQRQYNDKKEFTKPFQCQEKKTNKNCITIDDDSFPCLINYPRRCSTRVLLDTFRHKDPHSRYRGSMNIYLLYGSDRYIPSSFFSSSFLDIHWTLAPQGRTSTNLPGREETG